MNWNQKGMILTSGGSLSFALGKLWASQNEAGYVHTETLKGKK